MIAWRRPKTLSTPKGASPTQHSILKSSQSAAQAVVMSRITYKIIHAQQYQHTDDVCVVVVVVVVVAIAISVLRQSPTVAVNQKLN